MRCAPRELRTWRLPQNALYSQRARARAPKFPLLPPCNSRWDCAAVVLYFSFSRSHYGFVRLRRHCQKLAAARHLRVKWDGRDFSDLHPSARIPSISRVHLRDLRHGALSRGARHADVRGYWHLFHHSRHGAARYLSTCREGHVRAGCGMPVSCQLCCRRSDGDLEIFFTALALDFAIVGLDGLGFKRMLPWLACGLAVAGAILL